MWLAVVSQPCNRAAKIAAPGEVDKALGEFWVENPWDIIKKGHNLSAFERNRVFLNVRGRDFLDITRHARPRGRQDPATARLEALLPALPAARRQPETVDEDDGRD